MTLKVKIENKEWKMRTDEWGRERGDGRKWGAKRRMTMTYYVMTITSSTMLVYFKHVCTLIVLV